MPRYNLRTLLILLAIGLLVASCAWMVASYAYIASQYNPPNNRPLESAN
jgi:hypothetical protein